MPVNFPPTSVFPDDIDSDYTLFLVYNTSETVTTADNHPWSDEISIRPVPPDANEIWAENGFANIDGELFYYDSVEKNANGKIYKFKNCIRNLGGVSTKFVKRGSDVRGFVIAEHHNQLVDAIIKIERFIGTVDCDDSDTLVCCLNELDIEECEDDGICPSVSFSFDRVNTATDICQGVTINYTVDISGSFTTFRIDFGDGTFTTVPEDGTKVYPPGVDIDPIVTIGNNSCQIVVTGVEREVDTAPVQEVEPDDLILPITEITVPTVNISPIEIPDPDIFVPPIITPCIDLEPIDISIGPISIGDISVPSVISVIAPDFPNPISIIPPDIPNPISIIGPDIPALISIIPPDIPNPISIIPPDIPTVISIIPPDFPTVISIIPPDFPTVISIIPPDIPTVISIIAPDIPTTISLIADIPTTISVTDDIPEIITVIDNIPEIITVIDNIPSEIRLIAELISEIRLIDSLSNISLIVPDISPISVEWGTPPVLSCIVSIQCPTSSPMAMNMHDEMDKLMAKEAMEESINELGVSYDVIGIPSEIIIQAPEFGPIKVESNIPSEIKITSPNIPSVIEHRWADGAAPVINVNVPSELPRIKLDTTIPSEIKLLGTQIPSEISVIMPEIPSVISIEHDIPSTISVEGIPEFLNIQGGVSIENPSVEMFYRGDPIEVVVKVDMSKVLSDDEGSNCVRIIPCR